MRHENAKTQHRKLVKRNEEGNGFKQTLTQLQH